ncbi:mechanosensitive ion channel domain-containing protein [Sunxiuqinia indica]|uniref:mechanosensitive ion channel domain-containing protein n=1 Tax=Sunxiuqinia indica TaxID=2692584 RepID=UPI0013569E8E|nr:mechanosensitive ion channel domain-containing protein [Sunxiuqinia indica]
MGTYQLQIIETAIVIVLLIVVQFIVRHYINKTLKKFHFSLQRRRMTTKIMNLFIIIGALIALTGIWGIEKEKLLLFISSVLTILGIAFVAQWSILSNITAGLILYFNHPLKLGDHIRILEKDFIIEGKIDDVTFFFVHIISADGDRITVPNSIILQKNISVKHPNDRKARIEKEKHS